MLKQAFNALIRLNSRVAYLKRISDVELTSPIRISPSHYFSKIEGPSSIIAQGREFIIPVDSIIGTSSVKISFDGTPSTGSFTILLGALETSSLNETSVADDVESAVQLLPGFNKVAVTGSWASGFTLTFYGIVIPLPVVSVSNDLDVVIAVAAPVYTAWPGRQIKRGDKIVDSVHGSLAIDVIEDMTDIGGSVMGYRARTE